MFLFFVFLFSPLFATETLPSVSILESSSIDLFSIDNTTTIGTEKIKQSSFLSEALSNIAGVQNVQNGGIGGRSSFFLRGTESRHTLVLWGGVRLNDPTNTDRQFDAGLWRPYLLEKMIIKKSPEPVLYGGDALGGVVELVPLTSGKISEISLGYGSFDTKRIDATQSFKLGNLESLLSAQWIKTDGISRLNKKRFHASEKDGAEILQIQSQTSHRLTSKTKAQYLILLQKGVADQDSFGTDSQKDQSESKQFIFAPSIKHLLNSNHSLQLKTSINHSERMIKSTTLPEVQLKGDLKQIELENIVSKNKTKFFQSAGFWQESYNDQNKNEAINTTFLSTILEHNWDNISLSPGIRFENNQRFGNCWAYQTSAAYYFKKANIFSKWAQGYKPPSLYQLYAPPSLGNPVGNLNLKPEKSESREIGVNLEGKIQTSFIFFENHLKNLTQFTNTQGYQNRGELLIRGMELSLGKRIGQLGELKLNSTYQEFTKESSPVLRRPRLQHGINLETNFRNDWISYIEFKWVDARYDVSESNQDVKLNSYEIINLRLKKTFGNNELLIRVQNLLNRGYEDIYGYSVTPQSGDVLWTCKF